MIIPYKSENKVFSTYYTFFYKKNKTFFFTLYILFRLFMSAAHKLSLIMIQTHIIVVMFSIFYINLCFIMVKKTRYHQMRQIYKHCHCSPFCNLIKIDFMCINHFLIYFCPRIFSCYNMWWNVFLYVAQHRPYLNSSLS